MLKTFNYLIQVLALVSTVAAAEAESSAATPTELQTGYAPVNGLRLYYEVRGPERAGPPLILLHGGLGSSGMFGTGPDRLGRRVIVVDLQAHGRTADIARPLSFEALADDIAGLARHLKLGQVDVMGYSLGGMVAAQVAIRHPALVRKLVVVSSALRRDGWYPEILQGMAQVGAAAAEPMKQTPMYAAYAAIAPRVADWPVLLTKTGDLVRRDYDWSTPLSALKVPVLIVGGDADAVRTTHLVAVFALLGGGQRDAGWDGAGRPKSQLAILPGLTHYDIFAAPLLFETARSFLD